MTSFWWLILFFTDEFFRLESIICKKYTNTNGNDSKYTNPHCTVDCTEGCSVDCTEDCSVDCSVDCSLLHNISYFLFFISAASLWI